MLVKRQNGGLEGAIVIQVDDSFGVGTGNLLDNEERARVKINHKPWSRLRDRAVRFNGFTIRQEGDDTVLLEKYNKIEPLWPTSDETRFASMRTLEHYIGVKLRPGIYDPVPLIAPENSPTTEVEHKRLKKVIEFLQETKAQPLQFVPLNLSNASLVVVSDASFANARDLRRQLWYVIAIVDDRNNSNILHYGSNRCRWVTSRVLAAEVHGLFRGFDFDFLIRQLLCEFLGEEVASRRF